MEELISSDFYAIGKKTCELKKVLPKYKRGLYLFVVMGTSKNSIVPAFARFLIN